MERDGGADWTAVLPWFRVGKGQVGDGVCAPSGLALVSAPTALAALIIQAKFVLRREAGTDRIF